MIILKSLYFAMCIKCCFHGYFVDLGTAESEFNYVLLGLVCMLPMFLIKTNTIDN
jgi:hypothetical protein